MNRNPDTGVSQERQKLLAAPCVSLSILTRVGGTQDEGTTAISSELSDFGGARSHWSMRNGNVNNFLEKDFSISYLQLDKTRNADDVKSRDFSVDFKQIASLFGSAGRRNKVENYGELTCEPEQNPANAEC